MQCTDLSLMKSNVIRNVIRAVISQKKMSPYLSFRVGCKIKKEIGVKRLTQRTLLGEGDLSKFSRKPYLALTAVQTSGQQPNEGTLLRVIGVFAGIQMGIEIKSKSTHFITMLHSVKTVLAPPIMITWYFYARLEYHFYGD